MSDGTTGFVDRRAEQAEVRALLAKARLVTLTGPGASASRASPDASRPT